eukprot:XP_011411944.1 PREDICTED: uncharacterized protein LOC105317106 [Crassostrea gigas]
MTVTEKLADSIDTFCDSPKECRACLLLTTIAWFLHTFLSYGTDSWVELSEGPTESNQGLWNHCSKTLSNTDITCRESVSYFLMYRNQDVPAWLHATRFFQSIGLLMSLASVVSSIFCTFVNMTDRKRDAQVAAVVINFVTACSMLIGSSIYGGQYRYAGWLKGYYLSWSFAFSIIAGLAHIVSGSIYMFTLPNSDSIQTISNNETTNQSQQPGEIVNNRDVHVNIPVPSAPPDAYLYYIPPSNEEYHPRYPPRGSINTPQPASTNRRQNSASTQNTGTDTHNDDDTCIVCFDHRVEILLRPCYHFNLCEGCSLLVTQCPTCRGIIQEKIKPYR